MKTSSKTFGFNVLGVILGILVGLAGYNIAFYLFEWLGQFNFITSLLSWPVEYSEYALTAIFLIDIFLSAYVCKYFCEKSRAKSNYGIAVLFFINLIRYIIGFANNVSYYGFSFSLFVVYLFAFGSLIITLGMVANENYLEEPEQTPIKNEELKQLEDNIAKLKQMVQKAIRDIEGVSIENIEQAYKQGLINEEKYEELYNSYEALQAIISLTPKTIESLEQKRLEILNKN